MKRRMYVSLSDNADRDLRAWCQAQDRELSWALRKAVEAWMRSPAVQAVGNLDDWRPDKGNPQARQTFSTVPPSDIAYLRSAHSAEGGHEITAGGRRLWVLPDGRTSGQRRSRLITQALGAAEGRPGVDPLAHVYGTLALAGVGTLIHRGTE